MSLDYAKLNQAAKNQQRKSKPGIPAKIQGHFDKAANQGITALRTGTLASAIYGSNTPKNREKVNSILHKMKDRVERIDLCLWQWK